MASQVASVSGHLQGIIYSNEGMDAGLPIDPIWGDFSTKASGKALPNLHMTGSEKIKKLTTH